MKNLDDVSIRRAAMDLLARREHSRLELVQKLGKRFSDRGEELEQEVDQLTREGLQSDERLAEAFIRARAGRGQGPLKIRSELRQKGVQDEMISQALASCGVDWFDQVRHVADRKFGGIRGPIEGHDESMRHKSRVARFLQQRGFSFDHISSVLQG